MCLANFKCSLEIVLKDFRKLVLYLAIGIGVALIFRVVMTLLGQESYEAGEMIARSLFTGTFVAVGIFLFEKWTHPKQK